MTIGRWFNFKDVMGTLGIPLTKKNNWAIGGYIRGYAAGKGITPRMVLTEKTNVMSICGAKHCIAHYPPKMWDEVCEYIMEIWDDKTRQLSLF